jgi:nicotinamide-nucleotide amidase
MTRPPRAALIATGDELVSGSSLDTNSAAIARVLLEAGWETGRFLVLGDDEDGLVNALAYFARDHDAIVITGGLGPTLDDVTRHAAARAAGVELARDETVLAELRAYFAARGRAFAPANERQALFPRGSAILANPNGTAPGFELALGNALVFALPGPPREMLPMLAAHVLPRLAQHRPRAIALARRTLHLIGLPESAFADRCGDWMKRDANPLVGVTAKNSVLTVTVRAQAGVAADAEALAAGRAAELAERFAPWQFSTDEADLACVLGRVLLERNLKIATAESCTGGLLAGRLTQVPGISAVFERGWITYANAAKTAELGVPEDVLAAHGAVSREVAARMALGALQRAGARVALAITGIAGPGGGSAEKPVGLVYVAAASADAVVVEERRFLALGRDLVREFAVNAALDLALRQLAPRPPAPAQ